MRWIIRLAILAVLLAVAQRLRVRQTELAAITDGFDGQRVAIARTEGDLDDLDRRIEAAAIRLRGLDAEISAVERRNPVGVPQSEYDGYTELVARRNEVAEEQNALIARHRSLAEEYRESVGRHNADVAEANTLARRGTPWETAWEMWDDLVRSWT